MTWLLTDERRRIVAGPYDTPMDAVSDRHDPYTRIHKLDDGGYDLEAGFSALDHSHLHLIEA